MLIGILSLQGDYQAHARSFSELGTPTCEVKKPRDLQHLNGLVIPGGESTTLIKLMDSSGLWLAVREYAVNGGALFGTCAGMILLADQVCNPPQRSMKLINIVVERNGYGRQIDSAEIVGDFPQSKDNPEMEMIFIRAPRIVSKGPEVESLATCRGDVVLGRQDNVLVASFHPELTMDYRVHSYFVQMAS
tara:strand:+ start:7438 stop:8007 length:570 start_codon:yes stop_codon:yes gene_type:complete